MQALRQDDKTDQRSTRGLERGGRKLALPVAQAVVAAVAVGDVRSA
jgi:hypothetical protein